MDRELLIADIQKVLWGRRDVGDLMNYDVHNQMDHLKLCGLKFDVKTHEEMVHRLDVEWRTKLILDLIS